MSNKVKACLAFCFNSTNAERAFCRKQGQCEDARLKQEELDAMRGGRKTRRSMHAQDDVDISGRSE
jgi:hypothetical protein